MFLFAVADWQKEYQMQQLCMPQPATSYPFDSFDLQHQRVGAGSVVVDDIVAVDEIDKEFDGREASCRKL